MRPYALLFERLVERLDKPVLLWGVLPDELLGYSQLEYGLAKVIAGVLNTVVSPQPLEQSGFSVATAFVSVSIAVCLDASTSNAYETHLRVKQSITLKQ